MKIIRQNCAKEWHSLIDLHKQEYSFSPKEVVFNYGDPVKGIFFINRGNVKVMSRISEQEERIIRLANDNMILGHRGLHLNEYYIRAVAVTDLHLSFLPIEIFSLLLKTNPNLSLYMINFLSDELRDTEERLKTQMILDPKVRIAKLLVKLAEQFGFEKNEPEKLRFQLSRQDLSNMAGTTYETMIRTLNQFAKSRWIDFDKKLILIRDLKSLLALAGKT